MDAVFAIDISEEDFATLGENSFVPLLYLDGQTENDLFYCITFDALKQRERAAAQSGRGRVVYVCDPPHSQGYRAYLQGIFDSFVDYEAAVCQEGEDDTVLLMAEPRGPQGRHAVLDHPDYSAFAKTAVEIASKAIARDESITDHHIRI